MLYNKRRNQKVNSKKVLHKVRKHWVTISTALLMALGGVAAFSSSTIHADVNGSQIHGGNRLQSDQSKTISPLRQSTSNSNRSTASQASQLHSHILRQGLSNVVHNSNSADGVNHSMSVNSSNLPNQSSLAANSSVSSANQHNVVPNVQLGSGYSLQSASSVMDAPQVSSRVTSDYAPDVGGEPNSDGTVMVRYEDMSDGNRIVGFEPPVSDRPGASFSEDGYKGLCPSGYHVVKVLNSVNAYPAAGHTSILAFGVLKNQTNVDYNRIEIRYVDVDHGDIMIPNHQQENLSDSDGAPFDISQFTSNIPEGYALDTALQQSDYLKTPGIVSNTGHITNHYIPGVHLIQIGVKRTYASDANKNATVMINYVDDSGKVLKNLTSNGKMSQPFNLTPFESGSALPSDYQFSGKTSAVPTNYANATVDLYVNKIPPKYSKMTIDYQTSNGRTVGSASDTGLIGSHFDADRYQTQAFVPTNYKFIRFVGAVPQNFTAQNDSLIAIVKSWIHMPVNYQYNGKIISTSSASNLLGQPFDVKPYEDDIPSGFEFAGTSGNVPTTYQNGQSVNIALKKIPQVVNMTINYLYDGNIKSHINVAGVDGSQFSQIGQYENNVPAGFRLKGVEQDTVPATFHDGHQIDIDVVPVNHRQRQKVAHMMVFYYADGQNVGQATIHGISGHRFSNQDFQQYLTNLPVGYSSPQISGLLPTTYQNGQEIVVNVQKEKSAPKMGIVNVSYITSDGSAIGQGQVVNGVIGHPFNIQPYQNNVPAGYHFTGVVSQGSNVNQFLSEPQNVMISVAKDQTHQDNQPQLGSVVVIYFDPQGNSVGSAERFNGPVGTSFDFNSPQQDVPQGYHFVKILRGNNVESYQDVPQLLQVEVAKDQASKLAQMSIDYYANGRKIDSELASGMSGQPFNLQTYERNVPSGYQFNYIIGKVPQDYVDGDHVSLAVNPIKTQKQNQNAHMSVEYRNGSQILQTVPVNGVEGTNFDFDAYRDNLPAGYHYVSAQNVPAVFHDGDLIIVNVAADHAASDTSHNNSDNGGYSDNSANNDSNNGNPAANNNDGGDAANNNPGQNVPQQEGVKQPNRQQSNVNEGSNGNGQSAKGSNQAPSDNTQLPKNGKNTSGQTGPSSSNPSAPVPHHHNQDQMGPGYDHNVPGHTYIPDGDSPYSNHTSQNSNGKGSQRLPQTGEASSRTELLTAMLSLFSLMFFGADLIDRKKKRN